MAEVPQPPQQSEDNEWHLTPEQVHDFFFNPDSEVVGLISEKLKNDLLEFMLSHTDEINSTR